MSRDQYTAQQMIDALTRAGGVKAAAARALGCSRNTVDRYIDNYATVKAAYDEANETNLDLAEGNLMRFVRGTTRDIEGETVYVDPRVQMDALKFYLRTKGRARGYGDRQEITGADGAAIRVDLTGGAHD